MIVAWDVDDVLNNFTSDWLMWSDTRLPRFEGRFGDPGKWLAQGGISRHEYLRSIDQFRAEMYSQLEPNKETLDWFCSDSSKATHIALTKTPLLFSPIVSNWVMLHFGTWMRGVLVTPSPRASDPPGTSYPTKGAVLSLFHAPVVLVDDSWENLENLPLAVRPIIFPRPWNGLTGEQDRQATLQHVRDLT